MPDPDLPDGDDKRVVDLRTALEAEHGRRVAAEAIADLASRLSGTQTRQGVADAVHATMQKLGPVSVVAVGKEVRDDIPAIHQDFDQRGHELITSPAVHEPAAGIG